MHVPSMMGRRLRGAVGDGLLDCTVTCACDVRGDHVIMVVDACFCC
jgi:hypothetical protein